MDTITLATQLLGGLIAAVLAGAMLSELSLGIFGNAIAGIVGGALAGLILPGFLGLAAAAGPDGSIGESMAVLAQAASGAAGGAALMILTGLVVGFFSR
jgi:uncharacterized membrane protein YeaQ/YmgE (transglycosylase-associated protein family)